MELFEDPIWQMSYGERAAVEGVLHSLKPSLAIEIGSAEGACLRRIAQYSAEVHSFDLVAPTIENLPDHVQLHGGDSHQLLPEVLACFAEAGRNVDFVMVDGDHSAEGVRRDIEDLLRSPAIANTIILAHDIANELVRAGLDAVPYGAYPKVAHADLDFVPGYMGQDRFTGELGRPGADHRRRVARRLWLRARAADRSSPRRRDARDRPRRDCQAPARQRRPRV